MPRIPQAAFDTNPSMRVDGPNIRQTQSPEQNLMGAATDAVGIMAKLQDQEERTDAFTAANKVKASYQAQKIQYETALENVRGDGSFRYTDPTDDTPDVTKRRVIEGKSINDEYNRLRKVYDEGLKQTQGLNRSDIANELINQYIGDDLVQTKIRSNKQVTRVKQREVINSTNENMELQMSNFLKDFTTESVNPNMVDAKVQRTVGMLRRDAEQVRAVVGEEEYGKIKKANDNLFRAYASEVIKAGVTDANVRAADKLLSSISSPSQRELAKAQLERTKKTVSTAHLQASRDQAARIRADLESAEVIDGPTFQKVLEAGNSLKNAYIDPKYTDVKREEINAEYTKLMGTALSKKVMQDVFSSGDDVLRKTFAPLPSEMAGRGPSSAGAPPLEDYVTPDMTDEEKVEAIRRYENDFPPTEEELKAEEEKNIQMYRDSGYSREEAIKMLEDDVVEFADEETAEVKRENYRRPAAGNAEADLRKRIEDAIEATNLDGSIGDLKSQLVNDTLAQLKTRWSTNKDSITESVVSMFPRATFAERIAYIDQNAKANFAGNDIAYATKKESSAFIQDFKLNMAQGSEKAENVLATVLGKVGGTETGMSSHKRKVVSDLVRTDKSLTYLVALADLNPSRQRNLLDAARNFEANKTAKAITKSAISKAYVNNADSFIEQLPQQLRDSIRDNLYHEAVSLADKDDIESGMKQALTNLKNDYTFVSDRNSKNLIMVKNGDGVDYAANKEALTLGAERLTKLPGYTREQKVSILQRYGKGAAVTDQTPEETVDFYISTIVAVKPDPMRPNVHRVYLADEEGDRAQLFDDANVPVFFTGDQILRIGQQTKEQKDRARVGSRSSIDRR